jgi:hypothetical protein
VPEVVVVAIVLLLTGALATRALRRGSPSGRRAAGLSVLAAATGVALLAAAATHRLPPVPPQPADAPLREPADGDTTSAACRSCHPYQYSTWHASYHRTMTQTASRDSVIGDFGDIRLAFSGAHYRLFEREGRFFGEITSARPGARDGHTQTTVVPLNQTTGSHHMQIYWYASGAGRTLEAFPLVYLRDQQRWIPRLAAFVTPPSSGPTPVGVWNRTCIGCHSTHPRPRIDASGIGRSDSHATELGIACEACHGGGEQHAVANRSPVHRYRMHLSSEPDPDIVNPTDLPHVRSAQVCGQCHSVRTFYSAEQAHAWEENGSSFRPGDDLEASVSVISNATLSRPYTQQLIAKFPDLLRGSFWDDGIVRVTGREYNALTASGCFQRGELACTSCHQMHRAWDDPRALREWANDQLAPGMDTDRACVQCHERFADERLAADHTHHAPGSTGSECQNCHMPHTTYGLLKAVRAHEIGSPTVATSEPGAGRPNACNLCHLDRSPGWAADHLEHWYGQKPPTLSEDDRRISAGVRWALQGDAGTRALVAWSMGWAPAQETAGTDWLVPYLLELMLDPYDAVRIIAFRSLRTLPGQGDAAFDELASPELRAEAARSIRDRWASLPSPARERAERTLFDANGHLDQREVARLAAQRDDRPLNLAE